MVKVANKRRSDIDVLSGLMISYMIFIHIHAYSLGYGYHGIFNNFLCIFMPWFFFKSGMFHREKSLKERSFFYFKKLMIPFIFFTVVAWPFMVVQQYFNQELNFESSFISPLNSILLGGASTTNQTLWFFTILFVIKLLPQPSMGGKYMIPLSIVIFVICYGMNKGIVPAKHFTVPQILLGYAFYSLGYSLRFIQYWPIVYIVSALIYLVIIIFYPSWVGMNGNVLERGNYLMWCATCVFGIITVNNVVFNYFRTNKILEYIGASAMVWYGFHYTLIRLAQILWLNFLGGTLGYKLFALETILCIIMLPVLNNVMNKKRLSFLIGK